MRLILSEEKINLIAPAFIVLLVFFIPISSSVKSILLALSLPALIFTSYYRQNLYYAFNTLWGHAALVFFLYVVIACLWSEAPLSLRYIIIDKYSKLIFLPIFSVGFINPRTRQWVLNSYMLVMLLTCVLSILKDKNLLILNPIGDPGEVFYNHIVTGYMIALGVYLAGLQAFTVEVNRWQRIFCLFMMLLGTYHILFINSGKTGFLVYAILMTLLILQKLSLKKAIIGIMLFCTMIILAYFLSPSMQRSTRIMFNDISQLQQHQENNSLGFRIQFHQYAQSLFKEHPILGIGTGGFSYRFSKDQPVPTWGKKLNEPHGQYWLTLAEQGLIGIVLFLFFIGTLFAAALKLKETKWILLGTLISFSILSFSDTVFCYSPIGFLMILFSALSFGEFIEKNKENAAAKASDNESYEINTNLKFIN